MSVKVAEQMRIEQLKKQTMELEMELQKKAENMKRIEEERKRQEEESRVKQLEVLK